MPCVSILYATERMHFLITDATFHHALYFIPAGQILWLLELFLYIHRTKLVWKAPSLEVFSWHLFIYFKLKYTLARLRATLRHDCWTLDGGIQRNREKKVSFVPTSQTCHLHFLQRYKQRLTLKTLLVVTANTLGFLFTTSGKKKKSSLLVALLPSH